MKNYWLRRVAGSFLVLLVVLILNFLLFRLMPGDPVASILDPRFSPEAKAELQRLYGLDKPLSFQFLLYMKQMVTFEFGYSFLTGRPVWDELASRLPNTVALLGSALFLSALLGTWLGIQAALERGRWLEKMVLWSGVPFLFLSLLFSCSWCSS